MVDFINTEYIRLQVMPNEKAVEAVQDILIDGEQILTAFKALRDKVIFTSKRIIAVNIQGVTGKKVSYTSLPYSKIQSFSVEITGNCDLSNELNIWISSVGKIHFEVAPEYDIRVLDKLLSNRILV